MRSCRRWRLECSLFLLLFVGFFVCHYLDVMTVIADHTPTMLREIDKDHPYRRILLTDNKTHFLGSLTKHFFFRSQDLAFPPRYNRIFQDTLFEFDRIWRRKLGRSYILYAGTALGAYRHGGQTPWDDDLDLLVDIKYNASIDDIFRGSRFTVTKGGPFRKLYFTANTIAVDEHSRWPFIDLFFYKTRNNGREITIQEGDHDHDYRVYQTKDFFPPSEISYMGRTFSSPRCIKRHVFQSISRFVLWLCCHTPNIHRLKKRGHTGCVLCSTLHDLFPFAKYRRINETHAQQLISRPPPPMEVATMKENSEWLEGPVLRMPDC